MVITLSECPGLDARRSVSYSKTLACLRRGSGPEGVGDDVFMMKILSQAVFRLSGDSTNVEGCQCMRAGGILGIP